MGFYTYNRRAAEDNIKEYFSRNPEIIFAMENAAKSTPKRKYFLEEKARVIEKSVEEIKDTYPELRALFYFGRDVGDIDIAGLKNYDCELLLSRSLVMKYPLYDWYSLTRLSGRFPNSVLSNLVHENSFGGTREHARARSESNRVVQSMELLFGDSKYLEEMRLVKI